MRKQLIAKCHYKKLLCTKKIKRAENKVEFNLSLLDALHLFKKAWDNVTETTIINCFHKAQFIIDDGPPDDPPIEELEEKIILYLWMIICLFVMIT